MGKNLADLTSAQLTGLKMLTYARMYPQRCLQIEFFALSIAVKSMDTHVRKAMNSSKMPPRSLKGRNTAPILYHALINQLRPPPWDSSARRWRRIRVLSSRTSVSSSRRSLEDRSSGSPAHRPSSCRCRSWFMSSCCVVLARRVALEIDGAVLIRLIGRRASPTDVYKT